MIYDDADLDSATKAAAAGIFFNAGQVCSAGSRVLAQESVYDEVVARLTARAEALRMGDTADKTTALGPVISEKQMKSILDYVDIGQKEGATLVTGGQHIGDRGYYISPAVFANVKHEMRISQEEIFGPVVSVIKFKDEADAIRIANGTAFSLAAGVWSRDIGRTQRFARKAKAARSGSSPIIPMRLRRRGRFRFWPRARHRGAGQFHRAEGCMGEPERVNRVRLSLVSSPEQTQTKTRAEGPAFSYSNG